MTLRKNPSLSETIKTEVVCPNDTNPMGILQGGKLVQWMDIAAAVCAQKHAGKICVTASIDSVTFENPAKLGEIITIKAKITRAFNTSMEIFVEAWAVNTLANTKSPISKAYFSFVALNEIAKRSSVIPVRPETPEEMEQYEGALLRKRRKKLDKELA
jgi:acyl-CoA hydrolase